MYSRTFKIRHFPLSCTNMILVASVYTTDTSAFLLCTECYSNIASDSKTHQTVSFIHTYIHTHIHMYIKYKGNDMKCQLASYIAENTVRVVCSYDEGKRLSGLRYSSCSITSSFLCIFCAYGRQHKHHVTQSCLPHSYREPLLYKGLFNALTYCITSYYPQSQMVNSQLYQRQL